jgi:hypothetical protein
MSATSAKEHDSSADTMHLVAVHCLPGQGVPVRVTCCGPLPVVAAAALPAAYRAHCAGAGVGSVASVHVTSCVKG